MELRKTKRPSGFWSCDAIEVEEDRHGTWLFLPTGRPWYTADDAGALPYDVVVLLAPDCWCVTWWCDDPAGRRVEVDVCLPPERTALGWTFVDLELDPVRHQNGEVEIQDHDEFATACQNGWIPSDEAAIALDTAERIETALLENVEPWDETGWHRLEAAQRQRRRVAQAAERVASAHSEAIERLGE